MASTVHFSPGRRLFAGRALALLWAAFWTWFGLASGIGEELTVAGVLLHALLPGVLFLLFALVGWRWPGEGGGLLIAIGLLVALVYPLVARHMSLVTILAVLATMALPPIGAGLLLRGGRRAAVAGR